MSDEHKHKHPHDHGEHEHGHQHSHGHSHVHDHGHEDDPHAHDHVHEHGHEHTHEHGHSHAHAHKTHFHDPQHAAEFDRRTSGIRADLAEKLAEMLVLQGNERILDVATGTGRVARPVAKRLKGGRVVGV